MGINIQQATFREDPVSGILIQSCVTKVSLTAAQIKTASSAPVTVIAAPGSGKMIMNVHGVYVYTHNTTVFTSTYFSIITAGAASGEFLLVSFSTVLSTTSTRREQLYQNVVGAKQRFCKANEIIQLKADADSAVGDGTLDLYLTYDILTL